MKLYIAGPMSGLPDFNYPAFYKAAEQLRAAGYEVENPAENTIEGTASWLAYMRMSLVQISKVDGIALLPGWAGSRGALLEEHIGTELGLTVRYVETWLKLDMTAVATGPQDPAVAVGDTIPGGPA